MKLERLKKRRAPLAAALVLGSWGTFGFVHLNAADVSMNVHVDGSDVDRTLAVVLSSAVKRHPEASTFRVHGTLLAGNRSAPYELRYSRRSETMQLSGNSSGFGAGTVFSSTSDWMIHRAAERGESLYNVSLYGATREFRPALIDRLGAPLQLPWR